MVNKPSFSSLWLLVLCLSPVSQALPSSDSTTVSTGSSTGISDSQTSSPSSISNPSNTISDGAYSTNDGSVPLFTPTNTAQSYRAAGVCTSQALSYYAAQHTSIATNFAKIGDHTMVVAAGSTLTSIITGMDSYTNSIGVMTHPTFTFTVVGPTTTIWNDPAAFPTFDPFQNCCGYCKMPIFRPVIKYWPNPSKAPNTACLASCGSTNVFGGTTMSDNTTMAAETSSTTESVAFPTQYATSMFQVISDTYTTPSTTPYTTPYTTSYTTPAAQTSATSTQKETTTPSTTTPKTSSTKISTTSSQTTTSLLIPPQYSGIITERAEITPAPVRRADEQGSLVYYDVDSDGNTYYSPYIYVMLKSVVAENDCNFVGANFTSLTYSYLPGELSTMQFRYGTSAAFNFDDLPCPPDSVRYANGWNDGSCTYEPFLAPITQILQLDPAFQDCWIPGCNLWDPPHTLTPQSSMFITGNAPVVQPTSATPQPIIGTPGAAETSSPGPQMTSQESMVVGDPNTQQRPQPQTSVVAGGGGFDPVATASPDGRTQDPQSTPGPAPANEPTPVTVGSNTVVFHTTNVVVGSQTVQPGSAITVSGTVISLASSATAVVIGSSTIAIAPQATAEAATPVTASDVTLTAGGNTFTLSASASDLVIGSQTLTPGGQAVTQDGTTFSLQSGGGDIIVGSSTIPLTQTTTDIAGVVYTAWVGSSVAAGSDAPTASVLSNGTLVLTGSAERVCENAWKTVMVALTIALGLRI